MWRALSPIYELQQYPHGHFDNPQICDSIPPVLLSPCRARADRTRPQREEIALIAQMNELAIPKVEFDERAMQEASETLAALAREKAEQILQACLSADDGAVLKRLPEERRQSATNLLRQVLLTTLLTTAMSSAMTKSLQSGLITIAGEFIEKARSA